MVRGDEVAGDRARPGQASGDGVADLGDRGIGSSVAVLRGLDSNGLDSNGHESSFDEQARTALPGPINGIQLIC